MTLKLPAEFSFERKIYSDSVPTVKPLPTIAEHAKNHQILAKKSLGQNFLFDSNITDKIVDHAGIITGKDVIEIGPGPGGLTRSILALGPRNLVVIEKDLRCIELLQEIKSYYPNLTIIDADALKIDLETLNLEKPKIISNLPYNIGTELLFKWAEKIDIFSDFTLMFQREVAERICAKENDSAYGRLSVMIGLLANAKKCFDVSPKAFTPSPKVFSSVVHIVPKQNQPDIKYVDFFSKIVKQAFSARRKMIKKNLESLIKAEELESIGILPNLRAENLSVEDYKKIANFLDHRSKKA